MSEADHLDDGYPGCHPPHWGRGWRAAGRLIDGMDATIRRALAQPAKSAVALAAFGLIVGTSVRTLVLRHSEPASAAGSIDPMHPAPPSAQCTLAVPLPGKDAIPPPT